MNAVHVQLSFELHGPACLVKVGGELTAVTEREFTGRALQALAAFPGPVLFDLSGLEFVDGHGARALAKALAAVPPRETGLYQCSPAMRRILAAFGLDLPPASAQARPLLVVPPPATPARLLSRRETVLAQARLTQADARQSALRASEVMSRLSVTYAGIALNSKYRRPDRSEERGRLLALSGRASDLSRQYRLHATR